MKFLTEILGVEGAHAVNKITERAPFLKAVIVPRSVMAWISTVGNLGFEGELPGVENSYFSLTKSENTYSGALTIKDQLYTFDHADLFHVAASVGVALEIVAEPIDEKLKPKDLTQLGKSIDMLVKTEVIRKLRKAKMDSGAPGPANAPATPKSPQPPQPPMASQPQMLADSKPINKLNLGTQQGVKLKITKTEAERVCKDCGGKQLKNGKYHGCICTEELSKKIDIEILNDGYLLKFDHKLDQDAISTIIDIFKD